MSFKGGITRLSELIADKVVGALIQGGLIVGAEIQAALVRAGTVIVDSEFQDNNVTGTLSGGTYQEPTVNVPTIAGGDMSNPTVTDPTITGGSSDSMTHTDPTITGGSSDSMTHTDPTVTGGTITGSVFQTAALGNRIKIWIPDAVNALIQFLTGAADESSPGSLGANGGVVGVKSTLSLKSPQSTAWSQPAIVKLAPGKSGDSANRATVQITGNGFTDPVTTAVDQLQIDGSSLIRGVKFGLVTVNTDANGLATFPHGLGADPGFISVQSQNRNRLYSLASHDATNITVRVTTATNDAVVASTSVTFFWLALL